MEINDSMSGTSYANFNYEAIQEIDVKTAGAGAEYGNARSSFMSIVTKSGGNTLPGVRCSPRSSRARSTGRTSRAARRPRSATSFPTSP